jgi:hypothetical protein
MIKYKFDIMHDAIINQILCMVLLQRLVLTKLYHKLHSLNIIDTIFNFLK